MAGTIFLAAVLSVLSLIGTVAFWLAGGLVDPGWWQFLAVFNSVSVPCCVMACWMEA